MLARKQKARRAAAASGKSGCSTASAAVAMVKSFLIRAHTLCRGFANQNLPRILATLRTFGWRLCFHSSSA